MGRFRSTNEGTGTTSASLAPHTVDYLFLGIDAIICSPLINDLFVHPSLPWLSGRFTDCFLALSCPAGTIIYLVRTKMYYLRTKIMNLSWFLELIDPHRRYKKSRLGEKFPLKSRNLIDWSSDPKWHNSRLLKDKKILTVSFLWKRFRSVFFSRVGTTSRSPTCRQSIDSFVVHTSVYYYDITFAIRNIYLRVILINKFVFDERSRRVRSRAKRTVPLRLLFCMSYYGIVFRNSR